MNIHPLLLHCYEYSSIVTPFHEYSSIVTPLTMNIHPLLLHCHEYSSIVTPPWIFVTPPWIFIYCLSNNPLIICWLSTIIYSQMSIHCLSVICPLSLHCPCSVNIVYFSVLKYINIINNVSCTINLDCYWWHSNKFSIVCWWIRRVWFIANITRP